MDIETKKLKKLKEYNKKIDNIFPIEEGISMSKIKDYISKYGKVSLIVAIENNESVKFMEYLVRLGADVEARGKYIGKTPLMYAVMKNKLDVIKYLIKKHANINSEDRLGDSVLNYVVKYGNLETVKYFVENKLLPLNWKDLEGVSLFMSVCERGEEGIVKYLISKGVDVNIRDKYGDSPLFYAAKSGNLSLIKYLTEEKKLYILEPYVVFPAAKSGNLELVKYLEKKGFNLNTEDKFEKSVLFYAAESGNLELVKYLVELKGLDVNKKDILGRTPIMYAAESKLDVVKYLVEHGANIDVVDENGLNLFDMLKFNLDFNERDKIREYLNHRTN